MSTLAPQRIKPTFSLVAAAPGSELKHNEDWYIECMELDGGKEETCFVLEACWVCQCFISIKMPPVAFGVEADEYQEGLAPGYMFKIEVFDLKSKSFSTIRQCME